MICVFGVIVVYNEINCFVFYQKTKTKILKNIWQRRLNEQISLGASTYSKVFSTGMVSSIIIHSTLTTQVSYVNNVGRSALIMKYIYKSSAYFSFYSRVLTKLEVFC